MTDDQPTQAPGYPTPDLESAAPEPVEQADTTAANTIQIPEVLQRMFTKSGIKPGGSVDDAVERMRQLNSKLEFFEVARRIAFDGSLVSFVAVKQIRELYGRFDEKHPSTTEGTQ